MSTTGAITTNVKRRTVSFPDSSHLVPIGTAVISGQLGGGDVIGSEADAEWAVVGVALQKDASLDLLARSGNVAQFVSFAPGGDAGAVQRFSRIAGYPPNHIFADAGEAVKAVLGSAADGMVNLRSYTPESPRSREFVYGIADADKAVEVLRRLSGEGLHVIVNETVDIADGGVSGVVQGGTMEFAPDDTPRCVEKSGVASLPLDCGMGLLETVYGFRPDLEDRDGRLEFSVHPKTRGWRGTHTLTWEYEPTAPIPVAATFTWPNHFSRMIGDKAFGLLMAHLVGLAVPHTTVIGRRVAPFSFGRRTRSNEIWIRTCPREPEPGLYTTRKGWCDPYALLAAEDPTGSAIASVLAQAAVPAAHSGAALVGGDRELIVEGRAGEGDGLMLGLDLPELLPAHVLDDVETAYQAASERLGPIRFEWVHDGERLWVVQLHMGATATTSRMVVPGDPDEWQVFEVEDGIEALRVRIAALPAKSGLTIVGGFGLTSHLADLVRRAGVPTRLQSDGD